MVSTGSAGRNKKARLPDATLAQFATRPNLRLLPSIARQATQALRERGFDVDETLFIRDAHLPLGLLIRCARLEKRPGQLCQVPLASVCACQCGVEAGISGTWCAALPSTDAERLVSREIVACRDLVARSRERATGALDGWNTSRSSQEG
jgi:hypothetical protein